MAVAHHATEHEVGETFAALVRRQDAARQLWVAMNRDTVELWLLTNPLEVDAITPFYEAAAALYDRYPHTFIRFHLVNPRTHLIGTDTAMLLYDLPADAAEIPLHLR